MLLLLICQYGLAQQTPLFQPEPLRIQIPTYLPGMMNDPFALKQNDTLVYYFNGILFQKNSHKVSRNRGVQLSTPFETINELVDAYVKKDKDRIVNLYNAASEEKVRKYINGPQGNDFLTYVRSTAMGTISFVAAIEYKNGYIVFIRDNEAKVHLNYLVREGEEYKLSVFEDDQPTSWNLNVFFHYAPEPMMPVKKVAIPTSLSWKDSVLVQFTLPAGKSYAAVFSGQTDENPLLVIQDNGSHDLNNTKNKVSFYLPAYLFGATGSHNFYIGGFNYPVMKSSRSFFKKEAEYTIVIKE